MTQSFSLALLDPGALLTFRETGSCEFTIPEILFDLAYPGQYKRIIKSVVLEASTGQSEPTTDPAPPIRNAEVSPRIPTPSRELPTEESHDDRTTTALFRSRCREISTAVTVLGPLRFPSSNMDDRRGSTASVAECPA